MLEPHLIFFNVKKIDKKKLKFLKVKKIKRLVNKREYDKDVARHISRVLKVMYQCLLENITRREQSADSYYVDMQNREFCL